MDFNGSKYYEINRVLLLSMGLWPYDESILKRVKILILSSFIVPCIAAMISKIITSKYDIVITLRILSTIFPYCTFILKFITFLLFPKRIKRIMELVQHDWNTLKDMNELEIIRKYSKFGQFCTKICLVYGYMCVFGLLSSVYLPDILDFVAPLNFSRARKLPFDVEYFFIDEQKYFYIISHHTCVAIIFGITISVATESLHMAYVNHACGMFKIASYRLRHAFDQDILPISPLIKSTVIHTKIIAAIQIHTRSLKFYDVLWSSLAVSYFITLLIGIPSVVVNLFRVFRAIVVIKNAEEIIQSSVCASGHFVYMFCANYAGQALIDHSIEVHANVCNTQWYRVPLQQRKLILFIMHRSMDSCKLITGGILVLSLEGFTSLLATSISYFTVLISVQH